MSLLGLRGRDGLCCDNVADSCGRCARQGCQVSVRVVVTVTAIFHPSTVVPESMPDAVGHSCRHLGRPQPAIVVAICCRQFGGAATSSRQCGDKFRSAAADSGDIRSCRRRTRQKLTALAAVSTNCEIFAQTSSTLALTLTLTLALALNPGANPVPDPDSDP